MQLHDNDNGEPSTTHGHAAPHPLSPLGGPSLPRSRRRLPRLFRRWRRAVPLLQGPQGPRHQPAAHVPGPLCVQDGQRVHLLLGFAVRAKELAGPGGKSGRITRILVGSDFRQNCVGSEGSELQKM